MTNDTTPSASRETRTPHALVQSVALRHGLPNSEAVRLITRYRRRARWHRFCDGWWLQLLDAQFQTTIGTHPRIRCGDEKHLRHLIPERGVCHDCGCTPGEYHVFGCDAEECSHCGGQAFCCDCDDVPEDAS